MAETEEFVSSIKVRDLISAYESIADPVRVEYNRPRAKSLGNILNKNVIVRSNDYKTLEDIETAMEKVDLNLKGYQVYSKEKHVFIQEQLFNLLTCVINIEKETENVPGKKKRLITEIQALVSILNQKLPSNAVLSKENVQSKFTYIPHTKSKSVNYFNIPNYSNNNLDISSEKEENILPQHDQKVEENNEISVSKLKSFFEEKSKKSNGLEIVIKNPTSAMHYEVNIPYTERNLGAYRLLQKNSGNYISKSGWLRNVDISQSMSVFDLRRRYELGRPTVEKRYQSESENENTDTEESFESVKEVSITHVSTPEDEIRIISGETNTVYTPEVVEISRTAPQLEKVIPNSCYNGDQIDYSTYTPKQGVSEGVATEQEGHFNSVAVLKLTNSSLKNTATANGLEQEVASLVTTERNGVFSGDVSDGEEEDIEDISVQIVDVTDSVITNDTEDLEYANPEVTEVEIGEHRDIIENKGSEDILNRVSITTEDLEELEAEFEKLAEAVDTH